MKREDLTSKRRNLAAKVNKYQRDINHLAYLVQKEHNQLIAKAYCTEESCTLIRKMQEEA